MEHRETDEFADTLADVELRLDRLRALYEQYFQGIERLEPTIPRKEVDRRIRLLRKTQPRNTALRFRFNQIVQKYTTYQTYWVRVARQIEEGTYRRHVMRARKRREDMREQWSRRDDKAYEIDITLDEVPANDEVAAALEALAPGPLASTRPVASARPVSLSPFAMPAGNGAPAQTGTFTKSGATTVEPTIQAVAIQGVPPPPRAAPPPSPLEAAPPVRPPQRAQPGAQAARPAPPSPPPAPAPSKSAGEDPQIRQLYDHYVEARKKNNQRVDNVSYGTVAKSVAKLMPKLQAKHQGKKIDFKVVIKDGKVGLKPVVHK